MPAMSRTNLVTRVRQHTRDLSNSIFRQIDIDDFINEGINRIKQTIPQLKDMPLLYSNSDLVQYLPEQYQHLIAIYATARCYSQDERHYQASTFMNEFEVKLDEMKQKIETGELVILDGNGEPVITDITNATDYVRLEPYRRILSSDLDES